MSVAMIEMPLKGDLNPVQQHSFPWSSEHGITLEKVFFFFRFLHKILIMIIHIAT